tara:strand:- start:547 stop:792 length:246 start_codon:yes stop_codon:yes gene_type:complete
MLNRAIDIDGNKHQAKQTVLTVVLFFFQFELDQFSSAVAANDDTHLRRVSVQPAKVRHTIRKGSKALQGSLDFLQVLSPVE